jgi:uncharacterized protein YifN (PemK superfamily)
LGSVFVHIGKTVVEKHNKENKQTFLVAPISIGDRNSTYENDMSATIDIPKSK